MMKRISRTFILFLAGILLYTTAMYGYVWFQTRPATALTPVSALTSYDKRPALHLIHAVNDIRRAQVKEKSFDGVEIDINHFNGQLVAAHDHPNEKSPLLTDILAALTEPEKKTFWLDVKTTLTQDDMIQFKQIAQQFHIHPRRMLFEVKGGAIADLLTANGFPILLQIPSHFNKDHHDPQLRRELNAELEDLLRQYHPFAIAASLGKYPYLKTYFPHYNKAIYSSTTKRPSLKKYFLTRAMRQDPHVLVWMQDEYTALPF